MVGDLDLRCERPALHRARRVLVVVVEPCLADRDDARSVEQVDDRVDPVARFVGMQTDRRDDAVVLIGERDRGLGGLAVAADAHHLSHPGGERVSDRGGRPSGDLGVVDMAVAVDPRQRRGIGGGAHDPIVLTS